MLSMATAEQGNPRPADRPIRPRAIDLPLERGVAKRWLADNIVATALGNSVNMLFPAGERFFVRSVRHYLQSADLPPALRERVQGFFGQEGRHAQAHDRINGVIREQGYDVEGYLRFYERFCYGLVERLAPPQLSLSATAACEHFTAIMADNFLRQESFTAKLDPTMRKLLLWHAAEEIEHKSVAFDVLMAVAPRYRLRVLGMAIASLFLGMFWLTGTCLLLLQDAREVGVGQILADARRLRSFRRQQGRRGIAREVFLRGIREYLARDFHPDDNDNYALAQDFLAQAGML